MQDNVEKHCQTTFSGSKWTLDLSKPNWKIKNRYERCSVGFLFFVSAEF